jgi:hypothetical protein
MPGQDRQWTFFAEVDHLLDGTELMAETPVRPFQQGDWITITTRKDLLALSVNQLDKEGNPLVSSLSGVTFYLDHIEGERYRVRTPAA